MIDDNTEYIIFDTDVGIDDAWALLMLLKAEKHRNIKIIAITLVHGNTTVDHAADNCLRILESVYRTDVPVYKGAHEPLLPRCLQVSPFFGTNGFGDLPEHLNTKPDRSLIKSQHAVNEIYRLISENPGKITLFCVGPLTNIALAIKMFTDLPEKVKEVYLMGGNYNATGNSSSCAEFNFHVDPEAAFIVLNSLSCPIHMFPWETCMEEKVDIPMEWRIETFGRSQNRIMTLLNELEVKVFLENKSKMWNPCDAFVSALFLKPKQIIRKSKKCHATVELSGNLTRGQVVIDHLNKNQHNITIIEQIDIDECKKLFLWTAEHDGVDFE